MAKIRATGKTTPPRQQPQPQRPTGTEPTRLSLTATATFDLEAKAGDGSPRRPTFAIKGYTGAVMGVGGFFSPVIVDLSGLKAAGQRMPILFAHDPERIVGQSDSVKIGADGVDLEGTITGDNASAQEVLSQAKNGFAWQASIGASVDRREFLEAGKKATVNGREVTGPLVIAREATIFETSFVAIGADSQTSASVAASNPTDPSKGGTMFEQWLQAKGFDPAALSDPQRASLQAAYDAEQTATRTPPQAGNNGGGGGNGGNGGGGNNYQTQSLDQIVQAQRAEDERVRQITAMVRPAIDERPMLLNEIEALARTAIEAKSTVQEFEINLLRLMRQVHNPSPYARTGGTHGTGKDMQKVVEAAVCMSGGLDDADKKFDPRIVEAAEQQFRHGLGLQDLLLLAARERGYQGYSRNDVRGLLRAAFGTDGGSTLRAEGFSTLSIPGILSNVANKFLLQGFNAVESGWRRFATTRNVRDFKTNTSYMLTGALQFEKVGPGGEIKHGTVGEQSYTNKADTYGKMFAITRQDIINDDLGALTDIPMKLGRGAALGINDLFYTSFLAGVAANFWTSGQGNYISGGTTALSSASLSAAVQKFRKQTDPDGKPLGITPKILLVPPELEITAEELMTSLIVNTGGASTIEKVPNRNVWANKFEVVVASYLSNTAYTGYSTTAWYLIADPADLATMEVAFLNGRQEPVVETADADFDTLGIQMRGYHDVGVARVEYRASVRSAGA